MANDLSTSPTPAQPQTVPLSKIHELPGVFNPKPQDRTLGSMVVSIQASGIKDPVVLRLRDDGEYQLLSGYRRRRASELAKKEDIPAFVYEMTTQEAIAYRKAVKENPDAPIPGKLVEPADKARTQETETPAVSEEKESGQMKIGAMDGQTNKSDPGKEAEQPAETVSPDGIEKGEAAPAVSEDKPSVESKDESDRPTADENKETDAPVEGLGPADAEKNAEAMENAAPPVPQEAGEAETAEQEQPTAENVKEAEAPSESVRSEPSEDAEKERPDNTPSASGEQTQDAPDGKDKPDLPDTAEKAEAEHKPTVAELEQKAKSGTPISLTELAEAQKRENAEAKTQPAKRGRPKSTMKLTTPEARKKEKNIAAEKTAEAPAVVAKGPSGTAISQIFDERLTPSTEADLKSLPVPQEGESFFIRLHPAYLKKSKYNTFSVDKNSENFKELLKSVELTGIKDPVLARIDPEGGLEILSGQRRHIAAIELNYPVPTIIQKIDDADAKILVADGNLHRDKISSYDLSRALRMKMEGMKQKVGRRKKGYSATELHSDTKLALEMGMSVAKLNRIIRLSEATKGICDMVDDDHMSLSVAAAISYLKPSNQEAVLHLVELGYKPTNERVERMKKVEAKGTLDEMAMRNILEDKDIAPKKQEPPKQQEPQQPASPAGSAATPEPPIPASPDVGTKQISSQPSPEQSPAVEAPAPAPVPGETNAAVSPSIPGESVPTVAAPVPGENGPAASPPAPAETVSVENAPTSPAPEKAPDNPFKGEQERPEVTKVILTGDRLRKYFPDVTMTPREIEESVYDALEERRQRQIKQQEKSAIFRKSGPSR